LKLWEVHNPATSHQKQVETFLKKHKASKASLLKLQIDQNFGFMQNIRESAALVASSRRI